MANTGTASDALTVWRRACHVVLDQSGRARLHDTRAALNNIALGLEVVRHELAESDATPTPRLLEIMKRDLAAAADELSGLHGLITTIASDGVARLATCLEWAEAVARPVARRCGVSLEAPPPDAVPVREVDHQLGLALACVLVNAALQGVRGSRCELRLAPDPLVVVVAWHVAAGSAELEPPAADVLSLVRGCHGRIETNGDRRVLTIELAPAP